MDYAMPSRRHVLMSGSAVALAGLACPSPTRASEAAAPDIRPFAPGAVRLLPGPLLDATEVDRQRLLATDPDRLLHMFRITAGLASTAAPLGGWEAPVNELRGHFTGHFLSACALMSAHHGDEALRAKGAAIVEGLARCQAAHGDGYVSAFPPELFDRLKRRQRVWAPFYTLHKLLAGLIDMARLAGDDRARQVAVGLGDWTVDWLALIDEVHMQNILETEFGGMGESLLDLQALTGDDRYGAAAARFEKRRFLQPLAEGRDALTGLHANTHIPQVIAAARRFQADGDPRHRAMADTFWTEVVTWRTFATGGTSSDEGWSAPQGRMADELGAYTHECCCSYNMLKLTRQRFGWSGDIACADYHERVLFNAILGTQNPSDGMMLYYVPMQTGWWKMFSDGDQGFWCCDGTGVESFAKLGDSLYFHDADSLWVNLFAASTLDWRERGLRVVQTTRFPDEGATRLTFHTATPQALTVRLRIPAWAVGAQARLNGALMAGAQPGRYLVLDRVWREGDVIDLSLPMALHAEPLIGDPGQVAVMYGPLVLAGRLGTERLPPDMLHAEPTAPRDIPHFRGDPLAAPAPMAGPDPRAWLAPVPDKPLTFRTVGAGTPVELVPFHRLYGERYAIYWKVKARAAGTA
jgi:DUF1680 family protein